MLTDLYISMRYRGVIEALIIAPLDRGNPGGRRLAATADLSHGRSLAKLDSDVPTQSAALCRFQLCLLQHGFMVDHSPSCHGIIRGLHENALCHRRERGVRIFDRRTLSRGGLARDRLCASFRSPA